MFNQLSQLNSFLTETLNQTDFSKIIKDVGFGIELEVQLPKESYTDSLFDILDIYQPNRLVYHLAVVPYNELPIEAIQDLMHDSRRGWYADKVPQAIKDLQEVLNKYGDPEVGGYKEYETDKVWRIETDSSLDEDYGCEIITPNVDGKGMSYTQILQDVPKLCNALSVLQFSGVDNKTGLHVHVSYKDQLNVDGLFKLMNNQSDKYTLFSKLCFLANQTSSYYSKFGLESRQFAQYSSSLLGSIIEGFNANKILAFFVSILSKVDSLTNTEQQNKILIEIPVVSFLSEEFVDKYFPFIYYRSNLYLNAISKASHSVDYSYRKTTIENRLLGGEKGFDQMTKVESLSKILKLAVTQVLPVINQKPFPVKDIIKSTELVLIEIFEKYLYNTLKIVKYHYEFSQGKLSDKELEKLTAATYAKLEKYNKDIDFYTMFSLEVMKLSKKIHNLVNSEITFKVSRSIKEIRVSKI